ncbi:hypothetical protein Pcinc_041639 [Petrolisthes cinctipes]|uniref:Uncharacterized protein n=1 Tax=Petrolisthes cinctipes TaxID=88211 RepID=A0AAE1BJR5_PETCI|nr:hypothetical protein Pcinc_041639 [Petrolisthes cinctipes]
MYSSLIYSHARKEEEEKRSMDGPTYLLICREEDIESPTHSKASQHHTPNSPQQEITHLTHHSKTSQHHTYNSPQQNFPASHICHTTASHINSPQQDITTSHI